MFSYLEEASVPWDESSVASRIEEDVSDMNARAEDSHEVDIDSANDHLDHAADIVDDRDGEEGEEHEDDDESA